MNVRAAARSRGTSMEEMSDPSGRASRWQVAAEFAGGTTARMKYCSSMPAKVAGPGPSQVGVFAPTAIRSSFPPAWQMARAGALLWLENQPPPDPDSPSPVERTAGFDVSRGTLAAWGAAGAVCCSAGAAAGGAGGRTAAGFGLKIRLQTTATAMHRATVRRSLWFDSFMKASGGLGARRSGAERDR